MQIAMNLIRDRCQEPPVSVLEAGAEFVHSGR